MGLTRRGVLGLGAGVVAATVLVVAADGGTTVREPSWTPDPAEPGDAARARLEQLQGATLNDRLNAPAERAVVVVPAGVHEQADFDQPTSAGPYALVLWTTCAGIEGAGVDETFLQLTPESSTKLDDVPPQSTGFRGPGDVGTTNPLKVLHAGETTPPDTGPRDVRLSGFTLRGTDQPVYTTIGDPPDPQTGRGHNYNGIELYRAGRVVLDRLKVHGIPGSNSANPGETFSLLVGGGPHLDLDARRLEIDGRHPLTGVPVSASGIYHGGFVPRSLLVDVDVHHMAYGWGLTHYDVHGGTSTYADVRSRDNAGAFNWERCADHTFDLVRADNLGCRSVARPDEGLGRQPVFAVIDSDKGSVTVNFRDVQVDDGSGRLVPPSRDHPLLVVVHPTYWGSTQQQRPSDIHLFDASGRERPEAVVVLDGYELDGQAR